MKQSPPSPTYKLITSVRLALWRGWIYVFIVALAYHDRNATQTAILIATIFSIIDTAREYRNPQPRNLGLSSPGFTAGVFQISLGLSVLWLILNWNQLGEWPWLLLGVALTFAAYSLRPKLPRS